MPRVLVLGRTGMLGGMLHRVLTRDPHIDVAGTTRRDGADPFYFDVRAGLSHLDRIVTSHGRYDFVVNAIARTAAEIDATDSDSVAAAVRLNALLPAELAGWAEAHDARVIHVSTDGVFSGRDGPYLEEDIADAEDVYGRTKWLGEVASEYVVTLRCSLVGPDPQGRKGLLEWLTGQPEGATVTGFTDVRWNGVTTLQFAALCHWIVTAGAFERLRAQASMLHFCPNRAVSKYELVRDLGRAFRSDLIIEPGICPSGAANRQLCTGYSAIRDRFGDGLDLSQAIDALALEMGSSATSSATEDRN